MVNTNKDSQPEVEATGVTLVDELKDQRAYVNQLRTERGDDLEAQRRLIKELGPRAGMLGLVDEAKFVESMRNLGYKNTAFAIAELVDNSIQAGATSIHIAMHADKGQDVSSIAVIDDGHGMDPEMIRESVRWGGTHRHKDRSGFGRFGMGKPSACVSQGRRFTSFSSVKDGAMHSVAVDLDEIAQQTLQNGGASIPPPPIMSAAERSLPTWIQDYRESQGLNKELSEGTSVAIDKVDKATFKKMRGLERHLLEWLGLIYRYCIAVDIELYVNGKQVETIDPLFTLPGHRDPAKSSHDDVAEDQGIIKFEVRHPETKQTQGWVRVRFSRFPLTFPRIDKTRGVGLEKENANYRYSIMIAYNKGIHILRKGRQIDFRETKCPWTTLMNDDRYWGCEIDFEPGLDEEFELNSSKQQVIPSDRMWHLLKEAGVYDLIGILRKKHKQEVLQAKAEKMRIDVEGKRASEKAAEEAETEFGTGTVTAGSNEVKAKAEANRQQEARARSKLTGRSVSDEEESLMREIGERSFKLEEQDFPPCSPFFSCEVLGASDDGKVQIRMIINRNHRFYSDLYAHDDSTPHTRAAIEAMLFAIARHMAPATDKREVFYGQEVNNWSTTMDAYLFKLAKYDPDDADAESEDKDFDAIKESPADADLEVVKT